MLSSNLSDKLGSPEAVQHITRKEASSPRSVKHQSRQHDHQSLSHRRPMISRHHQQEAMPSPQRTKFAAAPCLIHQVQTIKLNRINPFVRDFRIYRCRRMSNNEMCHRVQNPHSELVRRLRLR